MLNEVKHLTELGIANSARWFATLTMTLPQLRNAYAYHGF